MLIRGDTFHVTTNCIVYLNQRVGVMMSDYRDIVLEDNEFYDYTAPNTLKSPSKAKVENPIDLLENTNDKGTNFMFRVCAKGNHLNGCCWNYVGDAVEDHKIVNAKNGHCEERKTPIEDDDAWLHKIGYYDNGVVRMLKEGEDYNVDWEDKYRKDREGIGNCYPTDETDTILFTNGVFTVRVTTTGSIVKKYEDEDGSEVTFDNRFDQDWYRGFCESKG